MCIYIYLYTYIYMCIYARVPSCNARKVMKLQEGTAYKNYLISSQNALRSELYVVVVVNQACACLCPPVHPCIVRSPRAWNSDVLVLLNVWSSAGVTTMVLTFQYYVDPYTSWQAKGFPSGIGFGTPRCSKIVDNLIAFPIRYVYICIYMCRICSCIIFIFISVFTLVYVCVYILCVYIYIYIYIYIYMYRRLKGKGQRPYPTGKLTWVRAWLLGMVAV